ncbi:hypothetical protein EDM76_08930 [bacterium]|nr:MAG: hypothetical protein EDM76_08930 [bacterium]
MSHHLQTLCREEPARLAAETGRRPCVQHHLLAEGGSLPWSEAAPQQCRKLHRVETLAPGGQARQVSAAPGRHEVARAISFHLPECSGRPSRNVYPRKVAAILCLDFDHVVLTNSITESLLERFAGGIPGGLQLRAEGERIRVLAAAFARIEAPRDELLAFVLENARPREGLLDLVRWCSERGWTPLIVTHAFDLAVGAVLRDLGLDRVAFHAGRARFAYRWRLSYLSPRGVELQDGFQLSYVAALRQAGDLVAMVGGPGTSSDAAAAASIAFVPPPVPADAPHIRPWQSFADVTGFLERERERQAPGNAGSP